MPTIIEQLASALEGRYTIERELGAGGMATVYLAHDLRHDRKVALKVLRPELAAVIGAERFLQEIKTTANLQHPHILALFDSGEAGGFVFYVMPYVEGESLRDRLSREKQLPVEEAVRIAKEVADALEYAHSHDVVHRDIKPENILLHGGHALVADFGIALAASRSEGGSRMTETGMSLGTPHYMSPEQAMGEREITAKADIYALGCVLYEMLTAEPPFTGATAQAIVARVMTEQPRPLTVQRRTIPPHVEAAVQQALEKLPADRFASAKEFAEALGGKATGRYTAPTGAAAAPVAMPPYRHPAFLALGAVAALGVALAGWALLRPAPPAQTSRYMLGFPASQLPAPEGWFALSPDGSRFVYVGPGPRGTQLWLKERGRYDAVPLAGTDGVGVMTFSPDGEWIAYTQTNQLKKLQVTGGAAITLVDSVSGSPGLTWLDDGHLVYLQVGARELRRIPAAGGASEVIWIDSTSQVMFPTALPGGKGVLFIRCTGACRFSHDLWAIDLGSGKASLVQTGVALGQYLPTGQVAYVRPDGALFVLPFDSRRLSATGAPVPVSDSISVLDEFFPLVAFSASGKMVTRIGAAGSSLLRYHMVWVDRAGRETVVDSAWTFRHTAFGANVGWALSPDGTRVAIGLTSEAGDNIWVKHLPAGPLVRVTFDSASEFRPRWMPDGRSVMFGSNRPGGGGLYRRAADGTGADQLVLKGNIYEGQISRDGQWLLARAGGQVAQAGGRDISAMRLGADTALSPLVATGYDESEIALSPDSRWLAYVSDETGRAEVFIRPFPHTDSAKYQVSTGGGVAPLWARNGRELFFVDTDRAMISVDVAPGSPLRLGEPRRLFRLQDDLYLAAREYYTPYDISPDGQRFIMARRTRNSATQEAPLVVTDSWFEELRAQQGGR
jgi:Tol biopolymer transport system component